MAVTDPCHVTTWAKKVFHCLGLEKSVVRHVQLVSKEATPQRGPMRRRHTGCHHLLGNSVPASACMCSRQNTGPQVSHAIKSIQSSRCLSDLTQQPAQVSNPITVLPCSTSTGAKPSHQGRNSKHSILASLQSKAFPRPSPKRQEIQGKDLIQWFFFHLGKLVIVNIFIYENRL